MQIWSACCLSQPAQFFWLRLQFLMLFLLSCFFALQDLNYTTSQTANAENCREQRMMRNGRDFLAPLIAALTTPIVSCISVFSGIFRSGL